MIAPNSSRSIFGWSLKKTNQIRSSSSHAWVPRVRPSLLSTVSGGGVVENSVAKLLAVWPNRSTRHRNAFGAYLTRYCAGRPRRPRRGHPVRTRYGGDVPLLFPAHHTSAVGLPVVRRARSRVPRHQRMTVFIPLRRIRMLLLLLL